jgi:hypothetical protein
MLPANPAYLEPPREITRDHPLTVRPKPTWLLTWALSSPACIAPFAPSPLPTTLLGPPSPPWRCTLGARSFALSPCGLRMCAADRVDAHRHGALAAPRSSSRRRRLLVQLGRLLCRTLSLFNPSNVIMHSSAQPLARLLSARCQSMPRFRDPSHGRRRFAPAAHAALLCAAR